MLAPSPLAMGVYRPNCSAIVPWLASPPLLTLPKIFVAKNSVPSFAIGTSPDGSG